MFLSVSSAWMSRYQVSYLPTVNQKGMNAGHRSCSHNIIHSLVACQASPSLDYHVAVDRGGDLVQRSQWPGV